MKKIFSLSCIAAILFSAMSCMQERLPAGNASEDVVTATLSVSIPDAMQTKAFGDASGISSVDYEIWEQDETGAYTDLVLSSELALNENLEGTLELKLIRFRTYGVFFWASTSDKHVPDADKGLQKIQIDYTANVENDAFAGRILDINAETDLNLPDVVLKRPFAQLNFATDDLEDETVTAGKLSLQNMTVIVPGLATYFDNATGLGTDAAAQTFTTTAALTDPFTVEEKDYTHILMFYALPVGETATADLDTKITVLRGQDPITVDWAGKSAMNNVPVSQNYRTNFYGSFLTAEGSINVKIDQNFEYTGNVDVNTGDTDVTATITAEELLDAATADGTYTVTGTITAAEAVEGDLTKEKVTIDELFTVTLDVPQTKADETVEVETYYAVGEEITVQVEKKDGAVAETADVVAYDPSEEENPGEGEDPVEPDPDEPAVTTVAEFLAAAEDETVFYTLKGTITSVANTTYGNFDLTDDTGTVYIYGLVSPDGATNKYWATSGAKLGDDIVVSVPRASFSGSPQGKDARFVELISPGTRAFYNLSTEVVEFSSTGGEEVVQVTAYNTDAAVTASSDNAQFTVAVDGYNVTISSEANELEEKIEGNVTVKVGDLEATTVKVSLAAKPASGIIEGGKADFNTISATNTSYVSGKTTAGWAYVNCAVLKGGTSDSSPMFSMIGGESDRALCMNGKTTTQGTITSPTLTTGCGTLTFSYGLPFSDTKIKFSVDIMQNGEIVKTFTVEKASATKLTKYSFEEAVNVAGDFQIVFKNLSPSNNTSSNKDRTAVWNVEWTGFAN